MSVILIAIGLIVVVSVVFVLTQVPEIRRYLKIRAM